MSENSHISVVAWMSDQFLSPLRVISNRQSTRGANNICLMILSQLNQSDKPATRTSTLAESLSLKVCDITSKPATEYLLMAQMYLYLCLKVAHLKQEKRDYITSRKH